MNIVQEKKILETTQRALIHDYIKKRKEFKECMVIEKILLETRQRKDGRDDVFIRASVWNYKKDYGIQLFSTQSFVNKYITPEQYVIENKCVLKQK